MLAYEFAELLRPRLVGGESIEEGIEDDDGDDDDGDDGDDVDSGEAAAGGDEKEGEWVDPVLRLRLRHDDGGERVDNDDGGDESGGEPFWAASTSAPMPTLDDRGERRGESLLPEGGDSDEPAAVMTFFPHCRGDKGASGAVVEIK